MICGANAYDKKYYFNKKFDRLPENIKEELHIICVLFTEECGGVFTISFTPFGHVEFDTQHEEGDLLYDEISARLLIKEIRRTHPEANIVAIDYDPGASEVNQLNRIKLMLSTAQKNLYKQEEPKAQ